MNAENLSLDFMKNRLFGDFLAQDGLTEIAVNRPGELHTKIRGKWQKQASPSRCVSVMPLPERWRPGMTIISTTPPILSATLNQASAFR
jgi:type IV secretion system protein VirB11